MTKRSTIQRTAVSGGGLRVRADVLIRRCIHDGARIGLNTAREEHRRPTPEQVKDAIVSRILCEVADVFDCPEEGSS